MRFKLVLSVKSESFGSVLPVSYQYELSAAVYRRIRENFELYLHWLSSNGFAPIDDCRNRLFSFSNLYIPPFTLMPLLYNKYLHKKSAVSSPHRSYST